MRRFLLSNGSHSDSAVPDWYPLLRAARYLGVSPWELQQQPICWQQWATIAEAAEAEARQAKITPGGGSD